jgi:hypothetical protein
VSGHLAAFFSAVAALFGALGHMLVVWEFLASGRALFAAFLTAFEHWPSQRAVARAQSCARLAAFGTVGAQLSTLLVLFLPIAEQLQTVAEARIALDLTGGARLSALLHMLAMLFSSARMTT